MIFNIINQNIWETTMLKSSIIGFTAGLLIQVTFFCSAVYADPGAALIYAAQKVT